MKCGFFYPFLCLMLSGCLGGGDGKGSGGGSTSSSKKAKACPRLNGKGERPWNSTTCKVVSCNAGYVKHTGANTCDIPDQGKYADKNGVEYDCVPPEGPERGFNIFLPNRGAVETATDCDFSCNAGFLKSERACNYPSAGSYVNAQGIEASCNPNSITLQGGATFTWRKSSFRDYSVATDAYSCPFSCDAGYVVKSYRTCKAVGLGKYAHSSGDEKSCFYVSSTMGPRLTWIRGAAAADICLFSCSTGFVKTESACNIPGLGKYVDSSGDEQSCSPITGATGGFKEFLANTEAVNSPAGCDFSCNAGFVKNSGNRTCNFPRGGKYANRIGDERSCDSVGSTPSGGFNEFLDNTRGVSYATGCPFSCKSGYVKSVSDYSCTRGKTCNVPNGRGKKRHRGYTLKCSPIPNCTPYVRTERYSTKCEVVDCNSGFVKNTGENTCDTPDQGKYADRVGDEQSCDSVGSTPSGGFNEFLDNTRGVSYATGCPFSCKSGYVKSVSDYSCTRGQTCNVPNGAGVKTTSSSTTCQVVDCDAGYDSTQAPTTQCQQTASGHYSLANNKGRTACPTPPHSSATTTTELSSADGCYTCDGGYLKNTARNTCDFP